MVLHGVDSKPGNSQNQEQDNDDDGDGDVLLDHIGGYIYAPF